MQGRSGGRNGGRRLNVGRVAIAAVILFVLIGGAAALIFGLRGCRTAAVKRSLPFRGDRDYCYTGDGFLYLDGRVLHFYSLNDENSGFSLPVESTASGVIGTDKLKVVFPLTASVGYTVIRPEDKGRVEDFIAQADQSMYEQKEIAHRRNIM